MVEPSGSKVMALRASPRVSPRGRIRRKLLISLSAITRATPDCLQTPSKIPLETKVEFRVRQMAGADGSTPNSKVRYI